MLFPLTKQKSTPHLHCFRVVYRVGVSFCGKKCFLHLMETTVEHRCGFGLVCTAVGDNKCGRRL